MNQPQRLTDCPFPPYTYVPGKTPHPLSHHEGHSCPGPEHKHIACLISDWRESPSYLWGIDLFNHGFFWEAHEAWEEVWLEAKPQPEVALWMKGLIKLAAAGVKALECKPTGVKRHARRAAEIFASATLPSTRFICGFDRQHLQVFADALALDPDAAVQAVERNERPCGLLELAD